MALSLVVRQLHGLQVFFGRKAVANRLQSTCDRSFSKYKRWRGGGGGGGGWGWGGAGGGGGWWVVGMYIIETTQI